MSTKKRIVQVLRCAWEQSATILCAIIAIATLSVLWTFIGAVMSYAYALLAGGGHDNLFCLMLLAWGPVVLFFLIILWLFSRVRSCVMRNGITRRRLRYWTGGPLFWIPFAWLTAPIILNGVSLLLRAGGFDAVGGYVFTYRYHSLPAIPMAIITTAALVYAFEGIRGRSGGSKTPPSPPSGGDAHGSTGAGRITATNSDPHVLQLTAS